MKPLVVGIGNPFRGDDGIGLKALSILRTSCQSSVDFRILTGDIMRLLDLWQERPFVLIMDAVSSDQLPSGTIIEARLPGELEQIRESLFSSHGFDLIHLLKLARVTNQLPDRLVFLGMVGTEWGIGNGFSSPVSDQLAAFTERAVFFLNEAVGQFVEQIDQNHIHRKSSS